MPHGCQMNALRIGTVAIAGSGKEHLLEGGIFF